MARELFQSSGRSKYFVVSHFNFGFKSADKHEWIEHPCARSEFRKMQKVVVGQ